MLKHFTYTIASNTVLINIPMIKKSNNRLHIFIATFLFISLVLQVYIMKYRDKNEIIAQILESANGNTVRLTKIMYDVYLSHAVAKEYLLLLIEKGLIEYTDGERSFKTTVLLLRRYPARKSLSKR